MATADEILAGAVEVASEGATQDKVLRIDNELRTISIPSVVKLLGVESDDDVNRIEFEMPRHYGGFDLSTFSVRVNYMNANGDGDIYKVVDLMADEEKMTFSWLVGRTAFMYKGDVQFVVCLKKITEDFVVEQEFNTTVASLPVLQGLEPDEQLIQRYPDIIEQILKYMETPVSSEEIGKAVEEYLKNNPVGGATINDDEVSAGSAWSSQKVSTQIDEKVSAHNTDPTAHTDVRELISGLTNRLNALADSDDTTLDQLSEIVAYIKSNKSLIDAITTSKVSVSDIVDDLVTNSSNKPLSAAQGVELKRLIDTKTITVDEALSPTSTNPVQNKAIFNAFNSITPPIDETLTQSGKAADAKKTGDAISSLKNDLTAEQTARTEGLAGKLGKTETAADSAKLGGKAPEYYLTPRNLLDNSDFRNPVNQRGGTSYSLSSAAGIYSIDRWILFSTSTATMTLMDAGLIFSGSGMLLQRFESGILPDTLTIAANFGDGSVTLIHTKYTLSDGVTEEIRIPFTDGQTLVWAALYEGSYTADTLPPYVPKGYAVELAECRRYYSDLGRRDAAVSAAWATYSGTVTLPTVMATASPTVIVKDMNGNIDKASVVSGNGEGTSIAIAYSRTNKSVDVYPAGTGVAGQVIRYTLALSSDL